MDRTVTTVIDDEKYQQIAGRKKYVLRMNTHSIRASIETIRAIFRAVQGIVLIGIFEGNERNNF